MGIMGLVTIFGAAGIYAKEAPQLSALVKAGKLPPVNERLPEIPLMLPVVDEIGQYGGILRIALFRLPPATSKEFQEAVH